MKLRKGQFYILGLVLLALGGCALGYLLEPYNISALTTWGIMCIIYTSGFLIGISSEKYNLPSYEEIIDIVSKFIINKSTQYQVIEDTQLKTREIENGSHIKVSDLAKELSKRIETN